MRESLNPSALDGGTRPTKRKKWNADSRIYLNSSLGMNMSRNKFHDSIFQEGRHNSLFSSQLINRNEDYGGDSEMLINENFLDCQRSEVKYVKEEKINSDYDTNTIKSRILQQHGLQPDM